MIQQARVLHARTSGVTAPLLAGRGVAFFGMHLGGTICLTLFV